MALVIVKQFITFVVFKSLYTDLNSFPTVDIIWLHLFLFYHFVTTKWSYVILMLRVAEVCDVTDVFCDQQKTLCQTFLILFRVVFWDILPCKVIVDRRFRGAYCLHHQG
jgi:hypothetical protein